MENITRKEFTCVSEIIQEYFPKSVVKEQGEKINEPHALGVLLAKTDIKNTRELIGKLD